jgi:type I restriction enzyme S subunit
MAHQMEIIDYSLFITGSAQPKLSQENLNNVILVVPSLSEQKTMAEYLNEKVSNIDSIIQDKKKQLTIVQGHKKSLIYEYVTGKKRITEVK